MILDTYPMVKGVILDMDGVLWMDNEPIGDLPAIFKRITELGIHISVATNNATRTGDQHRKKLAGFGVHIEASQLVSSPEAAGYYLKKKHPRGGPIFVVGESNLVEALADYGFIHCPDDSTVLAVVASLDYHLTYAKLRQAGLLIRAGAEFIGTNPDRTLPTPDGLIPGAGSILAALEAATDVHPVIAGKPSPALFQLAMERMGTRPENTLAIGDRLDTDIAGGQNVGCITALVLSGVTTHEAANNWSPAPDIIAANLEELIG